MASKQGYDAGLHKFMHLRVDLIINGDRIFKGIMKSYDQNINLILDEEIVISSSKQKDRQAQKTYVYSAANNLLN